MVKKTMKQARASRNMTYLQLREKTGLTQAALCRMEKGITTGNLNSRLLIESALGEEINWLETEMENGTEFGVLSDRFECERLFRMLVRKMNGLGNPDEYPNQKERSEFLDTIIKYLRKMKQKTNEKDTEKPKSKVYC